MPGGCVVVVSASPPLPGIFEALAPLLDRYGYLAVAGVVMIESFGVPAPGQTVLMAAGVYAGAGRLNIIVVALVAFLAAVVGDNIGYAVGHWGGRALVLRWGRYVLLTEHRLEKAEGMFTRHGGKIVAGARFIDGLRQFNGVIAGMAGMAWWRFLSFNALGAALWVGLWASLSYLAGDHIAALYEQFRGYELYLLGAGVIVVVGLITRHLLRRHRARQPQQ